MQLHFAGELGIQSPQEFYKLLVAVARITLANNPPLYDMKCSK